MSKFAGLKAFQGNFFKYDTSFKVSSAIDVDWEGLQSNTLYLFDIFEKIK